MLGRYTTPPRQAGMLQVEAEEVKSEFVKLQTDTARGLHTGHPLPIQLKHFPE